MVNADHGTREKERARPGCGTMALADEFDKDKEHLTRLNEMACRVREYKEEMEERRIPGTPYFRPHPDTLATFECADDASREERSAFYYGLDMVMTPYGIGEIPANMMQSKEPSLRDTEDGTAVDFYDQTDVELFQTYYREKLQDHGPRNEI